MEKEVSVVTEEFCVLYSMSHRCLQLLNPVEPDTTLAKLGKELPFQGDTESIPPLLLSLDVRNFTLAWYGQFRDAEWYLLVHLFLRLWED